ncbi:Mif2/CENP-C like-domain-containing protein [Hypoxylon sp. FL1284]|nr:Mif2/CENP-C like-domain-containing protein [Hypoxylon sp. FL1284]
MPPKSQSQRRNTQAQAESVYELGVQGRKTGLTLAERPRDENGMEAFDDLFSSPEKDVNGATSRDQTESDGEQDMEIDDESQMGPATTMKQRQNRPSLPRARSPIKTHLQSPARQNPHLGPTSSPTRGSIISAPERNTPKAVNRRLDFSKSAENRMLPPVNGQSKGGDLKAKHQKIRGSQKQKAREPSPLPDISDEEDDNVDEEEQEEQDDYPIEAEPEPEPEPELDEQDESIEEQQPVQQPKSAKRRGRKPKVPVMQEEEEEPSEIEPVPAQAEDVEVEDEPVKKKRGREARAGQSIQDIEATKKPAKRGRPGRSSGGSVEEEQGQENNGEERETKRQRTEKKEAKTASSKATATKEKGKPGRKRKSSGVGVDSPVVQRGPPLPKSRGLVINRQEEDVDNMRTTRSGRLSYRPIEFWRGEHAVFDAGQPRIFEDKGGRFVMPTVKSVLRTTDAIVPPNRRRRGRPAGDKSGRRAMAMVVEEEEVERDEWEFEPGRIAGECAPWRDGRPPEGSEEEDEVVEEELAISEAAIQLKDIKDATFRFAKTLTLPFFGSGVVDMPPGSEKRTKNSRKMQMVFFVHAGAVEVTVANNEFRIAMGGMWFVPRGNHYSITNNTDRPARIFFAQGCEMVAPIEEEA